MSSKRSERRTGRGQPGKQGGEGSSHKRREHHFEPVNNRKRRSSVWDQSPAPTTRIGTPEILRQIDLQHDHSIGMKDLAHALNISRNDEVRDLQNQIKRLVRNRELEQWGRSIRSTSRYLTGALFVHPDGFGFAKVSGRDEDVYLSQNELQGLIHGDQIELALQRHRGRESGRFVRLLKAASTEMVARIERSGSLILASPRSKNFPLSIIIDEKYTLDAKNGDWVRLEFDRHSQPLTGQVKSILGQSMNVGELMDVLQREHQLPEAFPDAALREARGCQDVDTKQHLAREDLTHLPFVTIDGEDARDFDDAICVQPRGEGFELWVAIADVAHYVRRGSALDIEAKQRGNSFYLPDRVIPMLPETLSNGLCSLNPHEVRLAMTVRMRFDAGGRCRYVRFHESIIRSRARLTYTQVTSWLTDNDQTAINEPLIREMMLNASTLTQLLLRKRELRGALELDLPEAKATLEDGLVTSIARTERGIAHRLIEEMMLATNIAVAEELEKQKKAFLYRTHPAPELTPIGRLNEFLAPLGMNIKLPEHKDKVRPSDLQRVLYLADQQPWGHVLHRLMLRSMQQASYDTDNKGHFGLAYRCYTHFTSPIRRYADLTIHRQIKATLHKEKDPYADDVNKLKVIGTHLSEQERKQQRTEWNSRDMLSALYHARHTGEQLPAIISGISKRRIFFELLETLAEASMPIDSLLGRYILDEQRHCLRANRGGAKLSLGDTVHVRVDSCDPVLGQINVSLIEATP